MQTISTRELKAQRLAMAAVAMAVAAAGLTLGAWKPVFANG